MQFSSNNSGASRVRIGATYNNRVALAKELRERAFSKATPSNNTSDNNLDGLRNANVGVDLATRFADYMNQQNFVGPSTRVTPRYAMGGARGGMTVSPQGSISNFIQKAGDEFVRSNAESIGQVSNEYLNQTPIGMIAKPFFGTDVLANTVGRVNSGFGESMRGEVTPMDIANVASFVPIPAGAVAKGTLMAGKLIGPTAERLAMPILKPALEPLGALVGGGTSTHVPVGKALGDLLDSTGVKVASGTARGAEQGENVVFTTQKNFDDRHRLPDKNSPSRIKQSSGMVDIRWKGFKKLKDRLADEIEKGNIPEGTKAEFPNLKEVDTMTEAFDNNALNQTYMDRARNNQIDYLISTQTKQSAIDQQLGKFLVFGHEPGISFKDFVAKNGTTAPDHLVSGELNHLEQSSRRAGNNFKTYKEVMEWAMSSVPKFKGYNLDDMINELGIPTKYWD